MVKRSIVTALTLKLSPNLNAQTQVNLDLGVYTHFHIAVLQYFCEVSRDGVKLSFPLQD